MGRGRDRPPPIPIRPARGTPEGRAFLLAPTRCYIRPMDAARIAHLHFPLDARGPHPKNPGGLPDAVLVRARSRRLQQEREAREKVRAEEIARQVAPWRAGHERYHANLRELYEKRGLKRVARLLAYPTPTGLKFLIRLANDPKFSEVVRVAAARAILKLGDPEL